MRADAVPHPLSVVGSLCFIPLVVATGLREADPAIYPGRCRVELGRPAVPAIRMWKVTR